MRRPLGVKVLGGLLIVGGALSLLGIVLGTAQHNQQASAAQTSTLLWTVALGVGLINLVLGIGLLNLQPWARAIVLVLAMLSLLSGTLNLAFSGGKGILVALATMFGSGWAIWYLLQPEIRTQFSKL